MKAVVWHGKGDVRVERVPDPEVINPRDIIVRVTSTAICGSDLHLYDDVIPTMRAGDVLGHEFMGEVVETGPAVANLQLGDRVVVPFPIACGGCYFCERGLWSLCDNSNPNAFMAEQAWGQSPAGIFGYSHLLGGYAGGQAEYVWVPYGDVGPLKVPESLSDEQALFPSDVFPTGYQAAEACGIQPGDTVAVWGCGPVGQFAIISARLLGAERIIAIDDVSERLEMAMHQPGVEPLRPSEIGNSLEIAEALRELTAGRGPDACIDAVGMEAHGIGLEGWYDRLKQATWQGAERIIAIDDVSERLEMAMHQPGVEPLRPSEIGNSLEIAEALRELTAGRGPDACIDAVGMEAHGIGLEGWYDRLKQATWLETE